MLWEGIRGHDELVEGFRRAIRRGRLGHAYLFVGPEGIGKNLFARAVAHCLLCERFPDDELQACGACPACRQFQAQTHPDFYPIRCPDGKNVLPIELFVGSKEHRGKQGLCYELSLSPMTGHRKIAIIDDADRMNLESANALLKTLEEPSADSLLILIASATDNVQSTIRSRCQTIRFLALPVDVVADLLLARGDVADSTEAGLVAALCDGSLSAAAQLLHPEVRSLREFVSGALVREDMNVFEVSGEVIERLGALAADTSEQRRYAQFVIRFCIDFYRRLLHELSGIGAEPGAGPDTHVEPQLESTSPEHVLRAVEMCERATLAMRQLDQNVSVPLCLEELFSDLARISRSLPVR